MLFQRPDDAIHRGFDKDAEADIASPGNVPLEFRAADKADVQAIVDEVVEFDRYTEPMKQLLSGLCRRSGTPQFVVSSAHPRMVDGSPSKNPRYLQKRPDLVHPRDTLHRRNRHPPGARDPLRACRPISR